MCGQFCVCVCECACVHGACVCMHVVSTAVSALQRSDRSSSCRVSTRAHTLCSWADYLPTFLLLLPLLLLLLLSSPALLSGCCRRRRSSRSPAGSGAGRGASSSHGNGFRTGRPGSGSAVGPGPRCGWAPRGSPRPGSPGCSSGTWPGTASAMDGDPLFLLLLRRHGDRRSRCGCWRWS